MIFRQKILKEEKIKFAILNLCVTLPWIILIFVSLRSKEELKSMVGFTLIAYLPLFILSLILSFKNLEWYDVFEDRIEVHSIDGGIEIKGLRRSVARVAYLLQTYLHNSRFE